MMLDGDGVIVLRALRWANPGRRNERGRLVGRILGDDDEKAIIARSIEKEFDNGGFASAADVVGAGSPIEFLQWILDHQDELIAFIQKIIALFEQVETE